MSEIKLTRAELKALPPAEYDVSASVRDGRAEAVGVGCRTFRSFKEAIRYETGGWDFSSWQKLTNGLCVNGGHCINCDGDFRRYKITHSRTQTSERAGEVVHLWALQRKIRKAKKIEVYEPEWLKDFVSRTVKAHRARKGA